MKKLILFIALYHFSLHAIDIPQNAKQLLLVSVSTASQNRAMLYSYERTSPTKTWESVFDAIPVTLGRNGLALGLGLKVLSENTLLPPKFEGDGKSPAGVFKLSHIFGYDSTAPNSKMPYIHLSSDIHCVDDSDSKYYNKIISKRSGYQSFESMRRQDMLYEWGIVVEHNKAGVKQRGSCIFIHVMNTKRGSTAGCTAMKKRDLLKIIRWLDKESHPVLVQELATK